MATDPACHMEVLSFCAIGCKTKLDAGPERYLPAIK
jgi:YHS domain-containing protein